MQSLHTLQDNIFKEKSRVAWLFFNKDIGDDDIKKTCGYSSLWELSPSLEGQCTVSTCSIVTYHPISIRYKRQKMCQKLLYLRLQTYKKVDQLLTKLCRYFYVKLVTVLIVTRIYTCRLYSIKCWWCRK